ncbi:hypothetical protein C6401_06045 [Arthrobacter woluwensis]|nr:hypothetical protein C6401_06045 [Arthrobacter woluwensis]
MTLGSAFTLASADFTASLIPSTNAAVTIVVIMMATMPRVRPPTEVPLGDRLRRVSPRIANSTA